MTNRAISIFNQLRPYSVGFDDVFDHFGRMFDDSLFDVSTPNYPPYNIRKVDSLKAIPNLLLVDHLTSLITIEGAEINKFGGINYVERI